MYALLLFFSVCCCCCVVGVLSGDIDEVKSESVMEGHSVTLHTDDIDIQSAHLILWLFGPQETLVIRINRAVKSVSVYDDVHDGMFRDRLQVDDQTGSLTITNITTQHSGLYQMTISSKQKTSYTFSVTVYTHLPIPDISSYCPQNSSSSSKCVLLCSVMNERHVTLSWYNESHVHSSISVSDLNIRLSLPLEVEYQDTDTYRCVINNPITNQTQHLNINDVCQPCSECMCCCYFTEAVIRLVLSAVVGVATIAVLANDIRSTRSAFH
ncbi:uncharacterized protein LOC130429759 isoform X2 [Triplophysa dalaica]|uniref:uncharacterized protein LOC130429759 isoform X2 n=2 Tax=Triplophysa dalaica TaxID=1582913 RepID=UPI0024DFD32D|nr:uncharacterized protein LOC130429759 isoform X2 [Triplophysa dalaica]